MGEAEAEIFVTIAMVPIVGAVILAMYGFEYQWLIDMTPAIVMFAVVGILAVGFGRAILSAV